MRPKPWWLQWSSNWITWNGTIYYPNGIDPNAYPWIIAHETVHILQQIALGWPKFLFKYVTSRSYRLQAEAAAFACERPWHTSAESWDKARNAFAKDLSGQPYFWAAKTHQQALDAIDREMK